VGYTFFFFLGLALVIDGVANGIGGVWIFGLLFIIGAGWGIAQNTRELSHRATIKSGLPGAMAIWDRAWYCGRDGMVFLPETPLGSAFTPAEFQRMVWRAGGYEHKLRKAWGS
jgi:hypothetical protein